MKGEKTKVIVSVSTIPGVLYRGYFWLNMAFISSSEDENIYISSGRSYEYERNIHSFHFTSEMKAIFNKNN